MKLTKKDLKKWFKSLEKADKERINAQKEKDKRIKSNMKALSKKAKKLGKEVPAELWVILYLDQPVGSWFFERYKEWLEYESTT